MAAAGWKYTGYVSSVCRQPSRGAPSRAMASTMPRPAWKRAKSATGSRASICVCVLSPEFNGPWVQVDGTAEVLDLPAALEPLVEYFRSISGEHPDWDEYRRAMLAQGKSLIRITIDGWGPIATGGFPARLADD